jgi:hypothetical protein
LDRRQSAASTRYFPRATTSAGALTTCTGPPVLPDRRFRIANAAAAMRAAFGIIRSTPRDENGVIELLFVIPLVAFKQRL